MGQYNTYVWTSRDKINNLNSRETFDKIVVVLRGYHNSGKLQGLKNIKLFKEYQKSEPPRLLKSVSKLKLQLEPESDSDDEPLNTFQLSKQKDNLDKIASEAMELQIPEIKTSPLKSNTNEEPMEIVDPLEIKELKLANNSKTENKNEELTNSEKPKENSLMQKKKSINNLPVKSESDNSNISKKENKSDSKGQLPLKGVTISVSGIGKERSLLKNISVKLGALYTFEWDNSTNNEMVLIVNKDSKFSDNPKYKMAKKDNATIVDQAWLIDSGEANAKLPYTKYLAKEKRIDIENTDSESDGPNEYDYDDGFIVDDDLEDNFEEWKGFVKQFLRQEKHLVDK